MDLHPDFKELLESFNARGVEYVIVGAYALAYHGAPRYTGDLDILIKPDSENAQRIFEVLEAFGFGGTGLTREDFEKPDQIIQLGVPPVRIDIVTSLSGVSWKEVQSGKVEDHYGGVSVKFIGRRQLLANKRAIGRKKDLADLEALGEE